MIPLPANVRVWLATGHTDMRKGFSSLGMIVQEMLKREPHSGGLASEKWRALSVKEEVSDGRTQAAVYP